ncbi:cell division ATP-binding protein FtsE [Vagococcus penaei]|uniref:cell division ATP-binding protein FtsE n=1 Tax=Vagococcus penaei TaxID=633807 RepID=UPI000F870735|nr:ATP-binding cassette domain-containing protein [Vagococcus penaei]RSU06817.1 cell division ATP-binding protein FtsE [Vagococcus penaei]
MKNVYKKYETTHEEWALKQINCQINQGEFVYLVGSSGAGKSTFLKLLTVEEQITKGLIQIGNTDLSKLAPRRIHLYRRQIGIVKQDFLLMEQKTVFENIAYVLRALDVRSKDIKYLVEQVLEQVGMSHAKKLYPHELSQGQQQKVAIARSIVNQPKLLLVDEPTANLDDKSAVDVSRIFFQLNQQGTTIVMATHHSTLVNTLKNRVIEMHAGQIIRDEEQGTYGRENDYQDIFFI